MANTLKISARGRVPVLEIYGEIGRGDLTMEKFSRSWKALGHPSEVEIRISSPGGDCFTGAAIFDLIAGSGTRTTTIVDGIAASMASYLFMLGHLRIIGAGSVLMLHNPSGVIDGGAADMQRGAGLLDSVKKRMAEVYAKRSGKPISEVLAWMSAETWFDAGAAIGAGLADEVGADLKIAASAFDLVGRGYRNVPALTRPKGIDALAAAYWSSKGKAPAPVPADPEDVSDLVPTPITHAGAFRAFHGRFAERK